MYKIELKPRHTRQLSYQNAKMISQLFLNGKVAPEEILHMHQGLLPMRKEVSMAIMLFTEKPLWFVHMLVNLNYN
jgi:hypothetical protein